MEIHETMQFSIYSFMLMLMVMGNTSLYLRKNRSIFSGFNLHSTKTLSDISV